MIVALFGGALISAPHAAADSIHLTASPPSPQGGQQVMVSVGGEVSEPFWTAESVVYVYDFGGFEAPCSPVKPSNSGLGVLLEKSVSGSFGTNEVGEALPKSFSFAEAVTAYAPVESLCAYIVHEGATTAWAGLVVHVTPSPVELEEAAAHAVAVKALTVRVALHFGSSVRAPGNATLYVTTSPYVYVTVRFARHGHRTEHLEWGWEATAPASVVRFTCRQPGGSYQYEVTARSDVGPTLVRRGRFPAISLAQCRAIEHREADERERTLRTYEERQREAARKERERIEQWEGNCRALGGTPVTLHTSEGAERACRSPRGGLLPAPI